jgi:predicted phage gp36 major capsid-like protein
MRTAGITIQVISPTSGEFSNLEERSTAFIEEVNEDCPPTEKADDRNTTQTQKVEEEIISAVQESSTSQPTAPTSESSTKPAASPSGTSMTDKQTLPNPESEMNQSIPSHWDTDPTPSQDKTKLDAWTPKVGQPLMDMFGMTILPHQI